MCNWYFSIKNQKKYNKAITFWLKIQRILLILFTYLITNHIFMNRIRNLLLNLVFPLMAYGQQIYNHSGTLIGKYENGKIYNRSGSYEGKIESDRWYNHYGSYIGYMKDDKFYDRSGSYIGYCNNGRYYDRRGSYIGSISNGQVYDRSGSTIGWSKDMSNNIVALVFFYGVFNLR